MRMRPQTLTLAIAASLAVASTAGAQPIPTIPATAKRVTLQLVKDAAWVKGFHERHHALPAAFGQGEDADARLTVNNPDCKVKDRRHGSCTYTLDGYNVDRTSRVACWRRVYVSIAKKTRRVKTRVKKSACETTPTAGATAR